MLADRLLGQGKQGVGLLVAQGLPTLAPVFGWRVRRASAWPAATAEGSTNSVSLSGSRFGSQAASLVGRIVQLLFPAPGGQFVELLAHRPAYEASARRRDRHVGCGSAWRCSDRQQRQEATISRIETWSRTTYPSV